MGYFIILLEASHTREGVTQGHEYQEVRNIGDILRGLLTVICLKYLIINFKRKICSQVKYN